jgi:hypothetical protein
MGNLILGASVRRKGKYSIPSVVWTVRGEYIPAVYHEKVITETSKRGGKEVLKQCGTFSH